MSTARSLRVMAIEADEEIRKIIEVELGALTGVEIVGWASSVTEALVMATEVNPELAIISLDLVDGDGFDLFGLLRESMEVLMFDTNYRVSKVSPELADNERSLVRSFVVATQLVPMVRAINVRSGRAAAN